MLTKVAGGPEIYSLSQNFFLFSFLPLNINVKLFSVLLTNFLEDIANGSWNNILPLSRRESMNFRKLLKEEIINSGDNFYNDNYDYYSHPRKIPLMKKIINLGKRILFRKLIFKLVFKSDKIYNNLFLGKLFGLLKYMDALEIVYQKLEDEQSKSLLVKLIAFRALGYLKVKLPFNSESFWNDLKELESNRNEEDSINLNFKPWKLYYHDLTSYDTSIKLYFSTIGCYSSILRDHYKHQISKDIFIGAEKGDVVFDLGGCYGDTALYFSEKVGKTGRVYSFEFIPGSIEIFERNMKLNPDLQSTIVIVNSPLWDKPDIDIYFQDCGGGSKVSFEKFSNWEGTKKTTTIDAFVSEQNIDKVDFIKSDIEGAEPFALEGAKDTLRRFRPKLAISIYHSMDDFVNIINQIDELNLGYKFYLGHASIYASETILFCSANQ